MSKQPKRKSETIAARLHYDNPDDRKALEVLREHVERGLTKSQVIVNALLALGEYELPEAPDKLTDDLLVSIREVKDILSLAQNTDRVGQQPTQHKPQATDIDSRLIESLQKRAKPGKRFSE